MTLPQRLIGLYLIYETYKEANVKTTPFTQVILDMLSNSRQLLPSENRLLT